MTALIYEPWLTWKSCGQSLAPRRVGAEAKDYGKAYRRGACRLFLRPIISGRSRGRLLTPGRFQNGPARPCWAVARERFQSALGPWLCWADGPVRTRTGPGRSSVCCLGQKPPWLDKPRPLRSLIYSSSCIMLERTCEHSWCSKFSRRFVAGLQRAMIGAG